MQNIFTTILRFCLCAWVGVVLFFNVAVLRVVESLMYDRPPFSQFSQPSYFLPPYFGFACALLGTALLCTLGNLGYARIGLLRRGATLLFVALALAMIAADHLVVYRGLDEMFAASKAIKAADAVRLFELCRLLKRGVLAVSVVAALLAVWPESDADLPAPRRDPAL